ncbi:MAG: NADH dehydrogenase [Deltaproteobacteria bacterium RIFCSPLOWO2_12_FULL_43_16]|nr:MAG: NADH dehydrogenase [Deltaproteobacteria bacterium GWA2_43_19]OGQ09581.1 MAG: NADH dehydrogenase [Deltaproteobacteria bacterium RIFCSPHIGHO2_02_FULL_43_33]OGQ58216.1 MAG: NADH dehydrogenase [Deltaproteobacteria bacterium RIFCSPLOWO2_12_FULL_43_16]HBR16212.1 NADH-quinone oxidoreductase subunit D [Deltaproteobacteria bacterium]
MTNTEEVITKEITLNMGPQHPSTHGVLHLLLDIKGENIIKAYPDIGYLHRGTEKIAENLLYHQFVPYTDRLDYMSAMSNNLAYVQAVEKLLGIEVTERAKYIRVAAAELSRIASHLLCIGAWALDLGAMTVLLYAFREREMVLDLFEMLCGARMTLNYLRVGGARYDIQPAFKEKCLEFVNMLPARINDYEQLLTENRIWLKRNKAVGVISAEDAINLGMSGPIVRGAGVKWDIRKDEPYLVYDRFDFDIPVGENGDCFDRYTVRMEEMRQAAKIVRQALEQLPDGKPCIDMPDVVLPPRRDIETNMEELIHHFKLISHGFKVPKGEAYSAIESPKGELGFYIVSDGSERPFRLKIRAPSFVNLQAINPMCKGAYLADVIAVVSSLDPVFGEADK